MELSLLTVPFISEALSVPCVQFQVTNHEYLMQFEQGDFLSNKESIQPDMFIGADHYWDIVMGEIIKGERGPTTSYTHLGWVFSGLVNGIGEDDDTLKAFWMLEIMENSVLDELCESITTMEDGHYKVLLP